MEEFCRGLENGKATLRKARRDIKIETDGHTYRGNKHIDIRTCDVDRQRIERGSMSVSMLGEPGRSFPQFCV